MNLNKVLAKRNVTFFLKTNVSFLGTQRPSKYIDNNVEWEAK